MFDKRYTPHPFHQLIPFGIVVAGAIIVGINPTWYTALIFVSALIIGIRTSLWIAWAGEKREETEYWENIGYDIHQLNKSSPDVWQAMGFAVPPSHVTLSKEVTGEEGKSPILEVENLTFGLSPSELRYIANEVLSGKRTLAETEWVGSQIGSSRMRKIKQDMFKAKLIEKANPTAKRQGFIPTREGIEYLCNYADDWAIDMFEKRGVNTLVNSRTTPHPPPTTSEP